MKRSLHGIAVILTAILLTLAYGGEPVGDLSFKWCTVFVVIGIAALVWALLPDRKEK